jgi:hypothetical protein
MRFSRPGLLGVLGLSVFLFNPAACEPDFDYGAEEMTAAVEGTWRVSVQPTSGPAYDFTLRLQQASAVARAGGDAAPSLVGRTALACGKRTLIKGAGACLTATEMPLAGQVLEGPDALKTAPVNGILTVLSRTFTNAALGFEVGSYVVNGRLSSTGEASHLQASNPGDTVTMIRLSRP